jgi:hypothetical protein
LQPENQVLKGVYIRFFSGCHVSISRRIKCRAVYLFLQERAMPANKPCQAEGMFLLLDY